ncbi:hypothetical protein OJ963_20115 [Streptomyces sp. RS2]|uniref:hypothetical protein n=1 Tax=Streptomyces sp. RS2 TaxID=1451205 RepID=UPI0021F87698|nr:hypothetical protein [Streptomyces sp. RS2]MCW1096207.1 hypothetical protein [Streptomyces sp. RS2]
MRKHMRPPSRRPARTLLMTLTALTALTTTACSDTPQPNDAGRATLSVTKIGPNEIEYEVKSGNNRSTGGAEGPGIPALLPLPRHRRISAPTSAPAPTATARSR